MVETSLRCGRNCDRRTGVRTHRDASPGMLHGYSPPPPRCFFMIPLLISPSSDYYEGSALKAEHFAYTL